MNDVAAGRVTLRRLRGLIASLPPDGTALWRKARRESNGKGKAQDPPDEWWTAERDLLAGIVDGLATVAWLHTEDARTGQNRPKPIPRPGTKRPGPSTRMPAAQAIALLARGAPVQQPSPSTA